MPALDDLGGFDIAASTPSLWVFRGPTGKAGNVPSYKGRWVQVDNDISTILKDIAQSERARITEATPYDLLAQNNEDSALTISGDETHLAIVIAQMSAESQERRSRDERDLYRSSFYAVKFVHGTSLLYAFRRTAATWKTRQDHVAWAMFDANRLTLDIKPRFELESNFDFFAINEEILVLNKNRFESILSYRQAHLQDFTDLLSEETFSVLFSDVAPLATHVGSNKLRLRRMSAVRQKGNYRDTAFMARLLAGYVAYKLPLTIEDGKIVPTEDSCSAIITALLDHRLGSGFSEKIFDVPSASQIGG